MKNLEYDGTVWFERQKPSNHAEVVAAKKSGTQVKPEKAIKEVKTGKDRIRAIAILSEKIPEEAEVIHACITFDGQERGIINYRENGVHKQVRF